MSLLTVDLGNSRCKLRLWAEGAALRGRPDACAEFATLPGLGAEVASWLAPIPAITAVRVCSVAGEAIGEELVGALSGRVRGTVNLHPDPGLTITCREPAQVGRDRLFGARAAIEIAGGDALVVAVGTALTVDAVRADRTFLGGAIAPGPELLARALATGTARLPLVEPRAGAPALGVDTEGALRAGIAVGLRGAARELVERLIAEAGLPEATVVVTGGARAFVLDPPAFPGRNVLVEADLVHRGLLLAAALEP